MVYLFALSSLTCTKKTCNAIDAGIAITCESYIDIDRDYDSDIMAYVLKNLDYPYVYKLASQLGWFDNEYLVIPETMPEEGSQNYQNFMENFFRLLFCRNIATGTVTCMNCNYVYQINNTILKMKLPPEELGEKL